MGGAENAPMLKILVCWLDMGRGSCIFVFCFIFFFLEQASHLKLLVELLQPETIPLKAQPVRPQVCAFVLASGVFTTSP